MNFNYSDPVTPVELKHPCPASKKIPTAYLVSVSRFVCGRTGKQRGRAEEGVRLKARAHRVPARLKRHNNNTQYHRCRPRQRPPL